jgi:hypothetical protein
MTGQVAEILSVWREAERILEEYEAREERDREAEQQLNDAIGALRALYASLTTRTIPNANRSLASSHERIAETRALLRRLRQELEGLSDAYEDLLLPR